MAFSKEQNETLLTIVRVSGAFGMLGPIVVVFFFLYYRKYLHTPTNRLVVYLSITCFFGAFAKLFGRLPLDNDDFDFCMWQAFTIEFTNLSGVIWTMAIALQVLLVVYFEKKIEKIIYLEYLCHALAWGIPLICCIIGLSLTTPERGRVFGDANLWCWISSKWNELRLAFLYVPIWAVFIFNTIAFGMVAWKLWRIQSEVSGIQKPETEKKSKRKIMQFGIVALAYLASYGLTWIWNTANRLNQYAGSDNYGLNVLHAFFSPFWGFANAVVFTTNMILHLRKLKRESSSSEYGLRTQGQTNESRSGFERKSSV